MDTKSVSVMAGPERTGKIRIGVLGGTFDPIHNGHLHVARHLREKLALDEVHLVTAARPPHKLANVLGAANRHEMVELACAEEEGLIASAIELENGFSFTVDTIRHMRANHPAGADNLELFFITSAEYVDPENPHHILTWTDAEEFLSLVTLVVTPRGHCDESKTRTWVEALGLEGVRVEDVPAMHVTSGMVKKALREGDHSDHMMPEAVARLIKTRGYYR
ncbi:MAG: nicotinate-nicotinamide nucleotide adenylyltransferase [Candidatus Obscuribacterales bacterium]|nr:nicotinate-nicotinamide nucleotide adenylyltransferase [Candidatus Obscuribacterales bacterium]